MPIAKYFKGNGSEVMEHMKKTYGSKKGKSVFYATANKQGAAPMKDHMMKLSMSKKFAKKK